mmetsp:Transcript_96731/g.270758  ORF Transcript_96731/g.270758 Transcript_96731/m.270758 type:complete len:160 (+) Transcript_96731:46-525(+)
MSKLKAVDRDVGHRFDFATQLSHMIHKKCQGGLAPITFSSKSVSLRMKDQVNKSHFNMDNALDIFTEPRVDVGASTPRPCTSGKLRGSSHDGQGRRGYLQMRERLPMKERYGQPVTKNMEYGFFVSNADLQGPQQHRTLRGGRGGTRRPPAGETSLVIL